MTHLFTISPLNLTQTPTPSPQAPVGLTPAEAARLDREAFLQFAEEVARVAGRLVVPTVDTQARGERLEEREESL